ncbi:hypothetical protein [Arsukibacterium sp.]|uniref:hypothetical protein n=1 Tax=Arsukibacterium sp. TaxID=1977258 RepID=UPI00299E1D08|nr:hypothetical protein [Arsukibacterium sp.]MDX1537149.1 hypothetical protein [Arsukibacterium sp.]
MEYFTNGNINQDAVRRGLKTARGSLHNAIDNVSDRAAPAFRRMSGRASNAVDRMADGAHLAADAISHKGEQLHNLQQQLVSSSRSTIRNRPLLAVGVAVAGGILLSWWLSRRQQRQQEQYPDEQ